MPAPQLTVDQIVRAVPEATDIYPLDSGGQKIVFSGNIKGQRYALKFLQPNIDLQIQAGDSISETLDDVTARARREVETMQQCNNPHLAKQGPIGIGIRLIDDQSYLFFTEELIDGSNLKTILHESGPLSILEIIRLGEHITQAVECLWSFAKIHRDIKPGNIMRRASTGDFILLDMGLVFDLNDESLSLGPVGTPYYFSPEQMDFQNRRNVLDFRSDLFSLGIVLYEMVTGKHPFWKPDIRNTWEFMQNILTMNPIPPINHRQDIPQELNEIILRLLAKRPALRYRRIAMLLDAFNHVPGRR